jgi:hypothetical protein
MDGFRLMRKNMLALRLDLIPGSARSIVGCLLNALPVDTR